MIVVCGEALVDMTPVDVEGQRAFVPRPGGSPYNVALGLARLGSHAAFLGSVSRDPFGDLLLSHLQANEVDDALLARTDAATPLAFVHLDEDGGPHYAFYFAGSALDEPPALPEKLPPDAGALHVGSIALALEPGASDVADLLLRAHPHVFTSFDPNIRDPFIPDRQQFVRRLEGWLAACDLVKVSAEDLAWLYPGKDPELVGAQWAERGPALVIVTRGSEGAVALSQNRFIEAPLVRAEVEDTVGAGDAFMSALLAWLDDSSRLSRAGVEGLADDALADLLHFASTVAAVTCTRRGANPPRRYELDAR